MGEPIHTSYWLLMVSNLRRAVVMAVLVGTLLVLINHGDHLECEPICHAFFLKAALSYCVPFAVSMTSAVLADRRRMHGLSG